MVTDHHFLHKSNSFALLGDPSTNVGTWRIYYLMVSFQLLRIVLEMTVLFDLTDTLPVPISLDFSEPDFHCAFIKQRRFFGFGSWISRTET